MNDSHETDGPREHGADDDVPLDLESWEAQEPASGFADRVMVRIGREDAREPARIVRPTWPRRAALAGSVGVLALAAAFLLRVVTPSTGDVVAKDRETVSLGGRALAVLEPGASVRWKGDDVVQSNGDVFYRVERGARFTVHTPAGDVEVMGTCFTVKVRPLGESKSENVEMQKRDLKSGAIGAALSALAFVAVYEGKVAVSHASGGQRMDLRAGEAAQVDAKGVKLAGPDGSTQFENAAAAEADDDPTTKANRSLVRQVGEVRSRLEAVVKQKAELEEKLQKSEANLAAAQEGKAPTKSEYELSQEDWKELAKDGTIKYRQPCIRTSKEAWAPSPEQLHALGLAPQDGAAIRDAYAHVGKEVWPQIKAACAVAVGSESVADKIGPSTCTHLVIDIESARDKEATERARREVGEIRAGIRPMPAPNAPGHPVTKMFLALTGANKTLEDQLTQSFGPEEAHRIAFSDELCHGTHVWGGSSGKN